MNTRKQVDIDPSLCAVLTKDAVVNGRTLPGEVEFRLLSTLPVHAADKIRKAKIHSKHRRV